MFLTEPRKSSREGINRESGICLIHLCIYSLKINDWKDIFSKTEQQPPLSQQPREECMECSVMRGQLAETMQFSGHLDHLISLHVIFNCGSNWMAKSTQKIFIFGGATAEHWKRYCWYPSGRSATRHSQFDWLSTVLHRLPHWTLPKFSVVGYSPFH